METLHYIISQTPLFTFPLSFSPPHFVQIISILFPHHYYYLIHLIFFSFLLLDLLEFLLSCILIYLFFPLFYSLFFAFFSLPIIENDLLSAEHTGRNILYLTLFILSKNEVYFVENLDSRWQEKQNKWAKKHKKKILLSFVLCVVWICR